MDFICCNSKYSVECYSRFPYKYLVGLHLCRTTTAIKSWTVYGEKEERKK